MVSSQKDNIFSQIIISACNGFMAKLINSGFISPGVKEFQESTITALFDQFYLFIFMQKSEYRFIGILIILLTVDLYSMVRISH